MTIDPMQEIRDLVAFEGRWAGTDAERRAAGHLAQRLEALGRASETEPTSIHPNYPVTHALHALLAIVGSVVSVYQPVVGAALVLFAAVSAFGDLSGSFHIVRRLTGRRASQNVTSREGGDKPGVVILTAHYDAARTGAVFGKWAVERRATFGRLIRRGLGPFEPLFWALLLILACTIVRLVGLEGTPLTIVQFIPTVVLIASVPLLVDIALSDVVPGANDNASGVATVLRLAERYGGRLGHFDVWVVFPGAEEALILGMGQWVKRHRRELDPERTVFLNVDTAGSGTPRWIEKEGLVVGMRYHPTLIRLCEAVGDGRGMISRNATDALAARAAGFPAITITSRNALDYAPHWHQPTDTPDRIDPEALERTYDFCCALLERLDEEIGAELA
ncbi:MAG TPA: M28 family peptidase [Thermoleophilaceae bacterium]|nr:M28 family peptidase [Thermoleophilaceae bacterium]